MLASLLTKGAAGQRCEYDRRHRSNVEKDVPFHCDFALDVSTSAREGAHGMVESQQWDEGAPMRRHTLCRSSRAAPYANEYRANKQALGLLRTNKRPFVRKRPTGDASMKNVTDLPIEA